MKRILTAVVVLPFLIASILIASLWWVFLLLAVAAMVLGLWEFYMLAKRLQLKPDPAAGYIGGAALITISLQNDPVTNVLLVQFVIIALTIGTLIAATASIMKTHHNEEMRIDAIRKGRTTAAVKSLFIRCFYFLLTTNFNPPNRRSRRW